MDDSHTAFRNDSSHLYRFGNSGVIQRDFAGNHNQLRIHCRIIMRCRLCCKIIIKQIQSITGNRIIDILARIHNGIACSGYDTDCAVLKPRWYLPLRFQSHRLQLRMLRCFPPLMSFPHPVQAIYQYDFQ